MPAPAPAIKLSEEQKTRLIAITRKRSESSALVQRARVILYASKGLSNLKISTLANIAPAHVGTWRKRFQQHGIEGLADKSRSGRPVKMDDKQRLRICKTACQKPPVHLSRWSLSTLAKSLRLPRNRIERASADANLHPHRIRTFNFSPDPKFGEKLLDVVGLYMTPPENAVVLCVDEKTGIQALDRTQPLLPMNSKKPRAWSNEYVRHGTRTLLASLDIATGKVFAQVRKDRTSKTFLKFMDAVVAENRGKQIHVVLDNLNTHNNKAALEWLSTKDNVKFHYTPTHASWVNLVECFFSILTKQGLQQSVHCSGQELERFLKAYIKKYNERSGPFAWTKGPDKLQSIIKLTEDFQNTQVSI
jgi:transposase